MKSPSRPSRPSSRQPTPTATARSAVQEFDKALTEPAHALFRVIDADNNNQISLAELERAEQILMDQISRLRVPEPPNSLMNQARKGANTAPARTQVLPTPSAAPAPGTVVTPR